MTDKEARMISCVWPVRWAARAAVDVQRGEHELGSS